MGHSTRLVEAAAGPDLVQLAQAADILAAGGHHDLARQVVQAIFAIGGAAAISHPATVFAPMRLHPAGA